MVFGLDELGVHAPPCGLRATQLPPTQYVVAPQSPSLLQPVHAEPSLLHTWFMPQGVQFGPQNVLVLQVEQLLPLQY